MKLQDIWTNTFDYNLITDLLNETDSNCTKIKFKFINKLISITIINAAFDSHSVIKQIINPLNYNNFDGFIINFDIDGQTDVASSAIEMAMFICLKNVINDFFLKLDWDYLIFVGKENQKNRLHNAIAQRLTITQPNVERFANLKNYFLIARF